VTKSFWGVYFYFSGVLVIPLHEDIRVTTYHGVFVIDTIEIEIWPLFRKSE